MLSRHLSQWNLLCCKLQQDIFVHVIFSDREFALNNVLSRDDVLAILVFIVHVFARNTRMVSKKHRVINIQGKYINQYELLRLFGLNCDGTSLRQILF